MTKLFLYAAAAIVLGAASAIAPVSAQFPPPPPTSPPPPASPPPAESPVVTPKKSPVVTPKKKAAPAPSPGIVGTWVGQLEQVGGTVPYTFEISITAKGAATKYPDLDCIGELTRVGESKSYIFFFESIIQGQANKGGRCPDGTITVTRLGDNLALGWFGSVQGDIIVASGTLSRR
jgi:hypothetical protein